MKRRGNRDIIVELLHQESHPQSDRIITFDVLVPLDQVQKFIEKVELTFPSSTLAVRHETEGITTVAGHMEYAGKWLVALNIRHHLKDAFHNFLFVFCQTRGLILQGLEPNNNQ